jgi:F0F1-type ATP synthase delta subunit
MSFTQDELQAFHTILEQKLALHRRELELSLDQRIGMLRQEFKQYLTAVEQDLLYNLPLRLAEQQNELKEAIIQRLGTTRVIEEEVHLDEAEGVEVQADIAWEDLMNVIDRVVGERLSALEETMQLLVRNTEHTLLMELRSLQSDLAQAKQRHTDRITADSADPHAIFTSIEQLEHIMEALQVSMTANHTLLSNRLSHHQHLPFERAHPTEKKSEDAESEKRSPTLTPTE